MTAQCGAQRHDEWWLRTTIDLGLRQESEKFVQEKLLFGSLPDQYAWAFIIIGILRGI